MPQEELKDSSVAHSADSAEVDEFLLAALNTMQGTTSSAEPDTIPADALDDDALAALDWLSHELNFSAPIIVAQEEQKLTEGVENSFPSEQPLPSDWQQHLQEGVEEKVQLVPTAELLEQATPEPPSTPQSFSTIEQEALEALAQQSADGVVGRPLSVLDEEEAMVAADLTDLAESAFSTLEKASAQLGAELSSADLYVEKTTLLPDPSEMTHRDDDTLILYKPSPEIDELRKEIEKEEVALPNITTPSSPFNEKTIFSNLETLEIEEMLAEYGEEMLWGEFAELGMEALEDEQSPPTTSAEIKNKTPATPPTVIEQPELLQNWLAELPKGAERREGDEVAAFIAKMDAELHQDHSAIGRESAEAGSRIPVIIFSVNNTLYALPTAQVAEVDELPRLTTVPFVLSWFLGVANLRGEIISVIDLGVFLGQGGCKETLEPWLIVLEPEKPSSGIAFVVEKLLGYRLIDTEQPKIKGVQAHLGPQIAPYIKTVVQHSGNTICLLSIEALVSAAEQIALPA